MAKAADGARGEQRSGSAAAAVFATFPDAAGAEAAAAALVERRLAACVQILAGCASVYRWEGRIERAREIPIIAKCPAARVDAAIAAIKGLHPYEVPEVIALPIAAGLPEYLAWIEAECGG